MKKLIILFLLISPMVMCAQTKKNKKISFEVTGNCEICKKRIEKAALSVRGVKTASWDIQSNLISIIYQPKKIKLFEVQKTIAQVGHDTSLSKAPDSVYINLPSCCLYKRKLE